MIQSRMIHHAVGASLLYLCMSLAPRFFFFPGIIFAYFSLVPFMVLGFMHGWRVAGVTCIVAASSLEIATTSSYGLFHLLYVYIPIAAITWSYDNSKRHHLMKGYYGIASIGLASMMISYGLGLVFLRFAEIDLKSFIHQTPKMLSQHIEMDGFIELLLSFFLTSWFVQVLLNAVLAKFILIKKSIITSKLVDPWYLPRFWDIPLTIGLLIMLLAQWFDAPYLHVWGRSIAINSALMLGLVGGRIFYTLIMNRTQKKIFFWLYVLSCFLLAWPFIIVVVLAFIEPWYDLTKIHTAKKQ